MKDNMNKYYVNILRFFSKEQAEKTKRDFEKSPNYADCSISIGQDKKDYLVVITSKIVVPHKELNSIHKNNIAKAEQVLVDNGIEVDEAWAVLQAIGYTLLNVELYPDT